MPRHLVIINNNGALTIVKQKDWARGNQHLFPAYDFINNVPTTDTIGHVLHENGYSDIIENDQLVIRYNYTQLP